MAAIRVCDQPANGLSHRPCLRTKTQAPRATSALATGMCLGWANLSSGVRSHAAPTCLEPGLPQAILDLACSFDGTY